MDALTKQEAFKAAFEKCQADPRADRHDLHDWLIRPPQQLMRQPMLLNAILENTDEAHADFGALRRACAAIQAEVTRVNEQKRQYERQQNWQHVHQRLRGEFSQAVRPHRQLLRKGGMQEIRGTLASADAHRGVG